MLLFSLSAGRCLRRQIELCKYARKADGLVASSNGLVVINALPLTSAESGSFAEILFFSLFSHRAGRMRLFSIYASESIFPVDSH